MIYFLLVVFVRQFFPLFLKTIFFCTQVKTIFFFKLFVELCFDKKTKKVKKNNFLIIIFWLQSKILKNKRVKSFFTLNQIYFTKIHFLLADLQVENSQPHFDLQKLFSDFVVVDARCYYYYYYFAFDYDNLNFCCSNFLVIMIRGVCSTEDSSLNIAKSRNKLSDHVRSGDGAR